VDLPAGRTLRVCVDLNVWVSSILADARGRRGTATQVIVDAIRFRGPLGPLQLVISWGMLDRLRLVLERKLEFSPPAVDLALSAITGLALHGPDAEPPHLLLGGTGLVALEDREDAHVLDVALAGRADLLITSDFKDFLSYRKAVRSPGQIAIHTSATAQVVIVHTFTAAEWIRRGEIIIP
jgi:predicted nucleic acid-binding protein